MMLLCIILAEHYNSPWWVWGLIAMILLDRILNGDKNENPS